jgi:hypothetical protein
MAHNHISGVGLPSKDDFDATEEVEAALRLIDVPLVDHLIYDGKNDFVSFAQSGNLKNEKPRYSVQLRDSEEEIDLTASMDRFRKMLAENVKKE